MVIRTGLDPMAETLIDGLYELASDMAEVLEQAEVIIATGGCAKHHGWHPSCIECMHSRDTVESIKRVRERHQQFVRGGI